MWNLVLLALHLFPVKRRHLAAFRHHRDVLRGRLLDVGSGRAPFELPQTVTSHVTVDRFVNPDVRPNICGDAVALPFRNAQFASAICTEVLEHLPDPQKCLQELRRVLEPGGVAYITAPMTWQLHYVPHDFFRFTRYGLEHLCHQAGLECVNITPIGRGVFSMSYARLTDVLVVQWTRLFKPLQYLVGNRLRTIIAALFICLPVVFLDYLADLLDSIIPSDDHIAWAVIARRPLSP